VDLTLSFKFTDGDLNRRLVSLLKKSEIRHFVDRDGIVHYSPDDEEVVENDLIGSIRNEVFPSWQVLSCPKDWTERYRKYMIQHGIPFREEFVHNEVCFLIPGKHRPHSWKMNEQGSVRRSRIAR
jgi:hypothetical protein